MNNIFLNVKFYYVSYFQFRCKVVPSKLPKMTCSLSKCWSNSLEGVCGGDLQKLEEYSSSPTSHLISISSFHKTGDNPQHMWQVWLTAITASTFSEDEIKNFTVCKTHKAGFIFWCPNPANFQF